MIVIRWQIVPFRDRVRRGGAVGVRVLLADPGSPGSVSGRGFDNRRALGTLRGLVSNRAVSNRA